MIAHILYRDFTENWRLWSGVGLYAGSSFVWVNIELFENI